ncbi:hypothetical protein HNQ34_002620 [Anoxybacillus tepidamans]|uniref:Sporulation protein n=1 Tax=Anoxybacteroides tepidamans TaxID=265948 RepID=A0A7W8IRW7_9BACL|nr:YhcN/YlaJ family sporulation lipoprotein [Anoxybacillus tepidamans]MBB5325519.1 hypothetical protein [Anoxybacillus tepidamans]
MIKQLIGMMIIGLLLLGCAREPEVKKQSIQGKNMIQLSTDGTAHSNAVSQSVAQQAVEQVKARKEIRDAVAVNTKNKLLLAYQVKQMDRFRMRQIEKDVKQQLELLFPDHDIIVSSDLKLFWKTDELRGKIQKDDMNERKLDKQIEKLKKLSEERT